MQYIRYLIYLSISIFVMVRLGRLFFDSGRYFLPPLLGEALASNVNILLLYAYYLLNLGYAVYILTIGGVVTNAIEIIEVLSTQLGGLFLIIGGMNLINILVVYLIRAYDINNLKK